MERYSAAAILGALVLCLSPAQIHQSMLAAESIRDDAPPEWAVAVQMERAGIRAGDTIGSLAYSNPVHAKWARLARVRIVAEVYTSAFDLSEDAFWKAPAGDRQQALDAFRDAGVTAVVSRRAPPWAESAGWTKVGDTGFSILPLKAVTARFRSALP